jgi:hypothetical protein
MNVVDFYVESWTGDDSAALRRLIAPDAGIEWNLDAPVDDEELVQTLHRIAVFADSVTLVSHVRAADGAALVYDLAAPFGTARLAEFLTVTDGRIQTIRQVYDVTAVNRYFPGLYEN